MKRRMNPRKLISIGIFVSFVAVLGIYMTAGAPKDYAAIIYPPIPAEHFGYIDKAVEHCGVPKSKRGFIAAVAFAESTFNPNAQSGAGAVGVMQLLRGTGYGTAVKYGIPGLNASTFTDAQISYMMGTCYIHYLMGEIVGNYDEANWNDDRILTAIMAGYNAGPARGKSYLAGAYNGPTSSLHYGAKILRASQVYNLDFARYDQEKLQGGTEIDILSRIREIVWNILLRVIPDDDQSQ